MRQIVAQADFTAQPLAELKQWLAITGARDDALLVDLLTAATALCERFTQIVPLATTLIERHPAPREWLALSARPVIGVESVAALAPGLTRRELALGDYTLEPGADGATRLRLATALPERPIEVRLVAGAAPDWASLDPALRQGIVRLAAHYYRERDDTRLDAPPAVVAALWRPFRGLRL